MNATQPGPVDAHWRVGGPGVAWRETSGEIVVLDLRGSLYFGLNGTAAKLWRRLTSSAHRAELVEQLQTLGADEVRAARDVDDFVAQLDRYGLLERVA
jgi:hypothetical protein